MKGKQPAKQTDLPDQSFVCTDHPSNRESVRPTVRPVLLRRKANIVLRSTTSTLLIATTKETTKEVARPKAATFVCALNGASILALSTIYDLRLSKSGRTVVGWTFDWMDGRSDAVFRLSGSFLKGTFAGNKANGVSPYGAVYLIQ